MLIKCDTWECYKLIIKLLILIDISRKKYAHILQDLLKTHNLDGKY